MNNRILLTLRIAISLLVLVLCSSSVKAVEYVGVGQYYPTLKSVFDDINNGTITGNIEIELTSSTTETAQAILYGVSQGNPAGWASYSKIVIYPSAPNITITGAVQFFKTDKVTIDGRVNRTGSTASLTITNPSTYGLLLTEATNCKINYCNIIGAYSAIYFRIDPAIGGPHPGCVGNAIRYNNLSFVTRNGAYKSLIDCSNQFNVNHYNDTISFNNFTKFIVPKTGGAYNSAINMPSHNFAWYIEGNSIYDSAVIDITAQLVIINIAPQASYQTGRTVIKNNYIGGSAPMCGGAPMTLDRSATGTSNYYFVGINSQIGTTDTSFITGNTIANIKINANDYFTTQLFNGIQVYDGKSIVTGNVIGSPIGTASLDFYSNLEVRGIWSPSGLYVKLDSNSIGSIRMNNGTYVSGRLYGIEYSGAAGTVANRAQVTRNIIGSEVTPNSLHLASLDTVASNKGISGIRVYSGDKTVTNNKVMNLTVDAVGTHTLASVVGLELSSGSCIANNNQITNLKTAGTGLTAIGIWKSNDNVNVSIDKNIIKNITATNTSAVNTYANGIRCVDVASISNNFIDSIATYATGPLSEAVGLFGSSANIGCKNNIVHIGNTSRKAYGISFGFNVFHNTIVLSDGAANAESAALNFISAGTGGNNICVNLRQNISGTSIRHFSIKQVNASAHSGANSIHFAPNQNAGAAIGKIGVNDYVTFADYLAAAPVNTTSIDADPLFINPSGHSPSDFYPGAPLICLTNTISLDYFNNTRSGFWAGALESSAPLSVLWSSFTVTKQSDRTHIEWATSSNKEVSHYEVQRSTNGSSWSLISKVTAQSNSINSNSYEYFDNELIYGKVYYRIKQVDNNGAFSYSDTKSINREYQAELNVSPNPSKGIIQVSADKILEDAPLEVVTLNGALIMQTKLKGTTLNLDLSNLPNATYLIRIANNKTSVSKLFEKQ
jgi:trimeric autotransporter adhesin